MVYSRTNQVFSTLENFLLNLNFSSWVANSGLFKMGSCTQEDFAEAMVSWSYIVYKSNIETLDKEQSISVENGFFSDQMGKTA